MHNSGSALLAGIAMLLSASAADALTFAPQGSITGLTSPNYLEVDAAHNLYAAEILSANATDFAAIDPTHTVFGHVGGVASFGINVAAAPNGHFYVMESGDVRDFDASWQSLGTFGTHGPGAGITADTASNIYVADGTNNNVIEYSPAGSVLLTLAPSGAQAFLHPNAVAVDAAGTIYVADSFNNRVEIFDSAGQFLSAFLPSDAGLPSSHVRDIALSGGTIFLADDTGIAAFTPDGTLLGSLAVSSLSGLAADGNTIYAARGATGEILIFAVPEPGALAMLAIAPVLLVRRRRA